MADKSVGDQQPAPDDTSTVAFGMLWYVPADDEHNAILGYLRDIQAAAEQLPELDPAADPLDPGFDPTWREGEK